MDKNNDKKTLIDYYDSVPEDVKGALFGAESAEIIQKIGQDYKLNVRQVGILADEAGLLMLGANGPKDFVKNLTERLGTDKDTVQKIVSEVNTRIFAKIRESLRKIHSVPSESKPEEKESSKKEEPAPMSQVIKPRTAPFVVSPAPTPIPSEIKPASTPANLPIKKEEATVKKEDMPMKKEEPKDKNVFEERQKEEGFRSKPTFTDIKIPEETEQKKETPKKSGYKGKTDPYREPVD